MARPLKMRAAAGGRPSGRGLAAEVLAALRKGARMNILYTTEAMIEGGLTKLARLAAVGTFVIVGAFSLSVHAEELAQNLGPVGPREPILATVGNKRVIAFYTPDGGHCDARIVVWAPADGEASSTIHLRVSLYPRQIVNVHTPEALGLQCADNAEKLTIADSGEQPRAGPRSRR